MVKKLQREPDKLYLEEGYAEIGLAYGFVTKVSLCDYPVLSKHTWTLHRSAQTRVWRAQDGKKIYLHLDVLWHMGTDIAGHETDHINQDTLDNRRENLRVVSHYENMRNTARHKERKGWMLHRASGLFFAYANYPDHVVISLGYWKTTEEAQTAAKAGQDLQTIYPSSPEQFHIAWKPVLAKLKSGVKCL